MDAKPREYRTRPIQREDLFPLAAGVEVIEAHGARQEAGREG
jgi:hypothetical protein